MKFIRYRWSTFPSFRRKQSYPHVDPFLGFISNTYFHVLLHTLVSACKVASDPVAELSSFFSKHPSLRNNAQDLPINLTPGIVELVLKRLSSWKPAYEFFLWASRQGGFKHTCYTYNAMAEILARAKKKDLLKSLSMDMVSSSIQSSPGALGFLIRCLGIQGLLEEANYVFDHAKLLNCVPNRYTYNCLLEALAKCERVDLVESRFREMIDLGLEPDKYTFTPLLQAYCHGGNFEEAQSVFNKICNNDWMDEYVFTILVVSFSKWGDVDRAFELIKRMENLNIRLNEKTFYILIHGFSRENRVDEALILFTRMKELGFSKHLSLYSVLIDGFCRQKQLGKVLTLYNEMRESGISPDVSVIVTLVSFFGGEGEWDSVNRLLEETAAFLDEKDIVSIYNSILQGLVNNSLENEASCLIRTTMGSKKLDSDQSKLCKYDEKLKAIISWLSKFKKAGIPNASSFNIVIDALCKSSELDLALDLANCMTEMGCTGNLLVYNNLIDKLCENDRLEEADGVLRKMKEAGFKPTQFTFNAIFGCLCRRQNLPDALNLIKEMRHQGHEPWIKHYSFLVKQLCSFGKVDEACNFLHEMVEVGFLPNLIAYSSIMDGWCKVGDLDRALNLFLDISRKHHLPDLVAHNVIISGLCKSGRMNEAQDIFNEMLEKGLVPSVVTYNLLIDGWCKIGRIEDALLYSLKMGDAGRLPTVVTYTTLIDGMCNSKQPDEALGMWEKMREKQCVPNRITYLALVSGLCKCDRTDEALGYFNEMEREGHEPNSFVYMALINAFISKKNLPMAFKLLKEMVQKAKCPNPSDKNYPLLINALLNLYEHRETSLDVKKLIQDGCIPDLHDVDDLAKNMKKLLDDLGEV
ncbi:putative pentatricopeptide repeat-containing protein At5g08310, mitochondrial [Aristolochia californica]|uniref:putative pentatricopeptide repeat-containing protein At5g08310, mitochondrial n=1 Tax=Aristolochia californica TaxID=171875 RepID=UPI0035DE032B